MEILKLNRKSHKEVLKKAAKAVKEGKVLVCPTDTVYGLLCDASNQKAVARIFEIKKRPQNKPIPIFVKDIKMAKRLAFIGPKEENFLKKVWPGKVTVVLKSKNKTIGFRIPKYKFINQLLLIVNRPLTGTSANISGKVSSVKIKEILKQFKNKKHQPDLILDAGILRKSRPSMVIDLTKNFKILRK